MSGCDRTPHRSDVSVSPTCTRTHVRGMRVRRKTGSRLDTHVLEELAGDGVGKTSQRVKRPEHTEPHKRLVRRRVRASDSVRGGCRHGKWWLKHKRAHCESETKGGKPLAQGGPTLGMTHVEPDWPPEPGRKAGVLSPHRDPSIWGPGFQGLGAGTTRIPGAWGQGIGESAETAAVEVGPGGTRSRGTAPTPSLG